tara:strand:- start:21 stop:560 length:540 start_codon:yes stop_codon:yes gene_type:complete
MNKFIIFLSFLFLFGCETTSKVVSEDSNQEKNEFYGEWKTDCINGTSSSYEIVFIFNANGTSEFHELFYYDLNCDENKQEEIWSHLFNYSKDEDNIFFDRTQTEMTIYTQEFLDARNEDTWCGISWSLNKTEDVTDLNCDGYSTSTNEDINTSYSVIQNNQLEFEGYPLFEDLIFYKQN